MSSFAKDVKNFEVSAANKVSVTARQVALVLFRKVIMRTPVGNPTLWKSKRGPAGYVGGRARGNWQCNIGEQPDPTVTGGHDSSGETTVNRAMNVMSKWKPMERDVPIWLANGLPYIHRLEYDHWSQQARNGMVRISLSEVRVNGIALGEAPTV